MSIEQSNFDRLWTGYDVWLIEHVITGADSRTQKAAGCIHYVHDCRLMQTWCLKTVSQPRYPSRATIYMLEIKATFVAIVYI